LYSGLLSDSSSFIQQIRNNGIDDDLCQQRLRLAGFCLGEAVEIKNIEVRQQLLPDLLKVRTRGDIKGANQTTPSDVENYLIRWSKENQWYENAAICSMQENNDQEKLLIALESQQKSVRQAALAYLKKFPPSFVSEKLLNKIVALTNDKNTDIRKYAIESVGAIGKTTKTEMMANHLIRLLESEYDATRETATRSLLMLENTFVLKSSMINIGEMIKSNEAKSRKVAARIFPLFDTSDLLEHFDEFVKLLSDTDEELRIYAKEALKKLIELHENNIPVEKILSLLEMSDANIRISAVDALSILNINNVLRYRIIDKLFDLAGDKDSGVKNAINSSLKQFHQNGLGEEVIAKLLSILETGDTNAKTQAINNIGKLSLKPVPDSVKERIFVALAATETKLRVAAADAISNVDTSPFVEEAVESLIKALQDKDSSVQTACLHALGTLGQHAHSKQVAETASRFLETRNEKVRIAAAKTLAQINLGEIDKKALDLLIKGARGRSVGRTIQQILPRSDIRHDDLWWELGFGVKESFQTAACAALATVNKEEDRILSVLREVIENKKNSKYIVNQALLAYAQVGSKIASERMMTEFSQLLEKKPELVDDFLRGQQSTLQRRIRFSFYINEKRAENENPFKIICEHLSDEILVRKLSGMIRNGKTNNRALALFTIATLNKALSPDALLDSIRVAIDDKEELVRLATLQALEALMKKKPTQDLCILLSKRLVDENSYIQRKAWEILSKAYISLDIWN